MTTSTPFQQMCSGSMIQGITINGTALHASGRIEQVWEEVLGSPELYGFPVHLPLRPGALDIPQIVGPREFGVGIVPYGTTDKDQAGHNDQWRTIARLVWSPKTPLTVTRTVRFTAGDETHECSAKFIGGLNPTMIVPGAMSRLSLRFLNLDGYWYAQTDVIDTISGGGGTYTITGDATTRRVSLTFSGGTGVQTLTNTTNGVAVAYNGDTTVTDVDLDVFGFTADQGGSNVVGNVTHSGDEFWMAVDPGDNVFTLTGGGSVTIQAREAYL